jgi:hypothetical protein
MDEFVAPAAKNFATYKYLCVPIMHLAELSNICIISFSASFPMTALFVDVRVLGENHSKEDVLNTHGRPQS